jgi:hypothetical protein
MQRLPSIDVGCEVAHPFWYLASRVNTTAWTFRSPSKPPSLRRSAAPALARVRGRSRDESQPKKTQPRRREGCSAQRPMRSRWNAAAAVCLDPSSDCSNALISQRLRRSSLQLIPQFGIRIFPKGFSHGKSDRIVPRPAAFAAGRRLAFWS